MSAIARYYNQRGVEIHGYDRVSTTLTQELEKEGMHIHYEDDVKYIPEGVDLVVLTPAIPKNHTEWQYFRDNNYPIKKRAEVLGILSKNQRCLAVGGTHGKTTTSSLLTHLLRSSDIDCSAFLGGISLSLGSNFVNGSTDFVVVEADEFDRSFLHLHPSIAIITSTDADHLDIYGDANHVLDSYQQFAAQTKDVLIYKEGLLLFDGKHKPSAKEQHTYNTQNTTADAYAENIRIENGYFVFDYICKDKGIAMRNLIFSQSGRHNVENAVGAITAALYAGAHEAGLRKGLETFKGIKRRFEFIVREENQVFIDDYAHHPSELNAAIEAARTLYPDKKIIGVFQPHLFTRTRDFVTGFADSLDRLDEIILLDIYPARELPIEGVTSQIIFDLMKNPNKTLIKKEELLAFLQNNPKPEVFLSLGAGDVGAMINEIKAAIAH